LIGIWKLCFPFKELKVIRGQIAPFPHTLFSPNASDLTFEIAILFKISYCNAFRIDTIPRVQDKVCKYKAVECLRSILGF
jgi:hypothetical protein